MERAPVAALKERALSVAPCRRALLFYYPGCAGRVLRLQGQESGRTTLGHDVAQCYTQSRNWPKLKRRKLRWIEMGLVQPFLHTFSGINLAPTVKI